MIQHLATVNKILFTKGGFSHKNCTKWFSFSAGALPQAAGLRWGSYDAGLPSLQWDENTSPSSSTYSDLDAHSHFDHRRTDNAKTQGRRDQ